MENDIRNLLATTPAFSIQQPWVWAFLYGGKKIENRSWRTKFRGKFLIHAGKGFDMEGWYWLSMKQKQLGIVLPHHLEFKRGLLPGTQRGGILGCADLVDCVQESDSPWFFGPHGFVIHNASPMPFYPCKGALGFFKVKDCDD